MKLRLLRFFLIGVLIILTGCTSSPPTIETYTITTKPETATSAQPTETQIPTETPIPPTRTPAPPTPTPLPATDTVCASGCDFTTIQAAINAVKSTDGVIIEITDPVHTESGIIVNKDLTIRGLGIDATIIQGHEEIGKASDRIFLIEEGINATIEILTIRHGYAGDDKGGGILNHGILTLSKCLITDNISGGGGGIFNDGDITIINSTISNNITEDNWVPGILACGSGGGMRCGRGTVLLINSTISGNQAGTRSRGTGGGIRIGCNCSAEFINSTISGNKSTQYGGGIVVKGSVEMTNCTVSNNVTSTEGGGVFIGAGGELDYSNTIIANNSGAKGNCAIADPDDFGIVGTIGTNINNIVVGGGCDAKYSDDPNLGPLSDNGGHTWTHALLPGSPAIDAISTGDCLLTTDQRGYERPVFHSSTDSPCDIGSYELQIK